MMTLHTWSGFGRSYCAKTGEMVSKVNANNENEAKTPLKITTHPSQANAKTA